jgi:hypothetical protein
VSAAALLLAALQRRGVRLAAAGEHLRVVAPPGTLTPADREALLAHKAALLAVLRPPGRACFACGTRAWYRPRPADCPQYWTCQVCHPLPGGVEAAP